MPTTGISRWQGALAVAADDRLVKRAAPGPRGGGPAAARVVADLRQALAGLAAALPDDDAVFGQPPAHRVDLGGAVGAVALAHPVPRLEVLLCGGLDRDAAQVGAARRRAASGQSVPPNRRERHAHAGA
jgi:hypothetical protein